MPTKREECKTLVEKICTNFEASSYNASVKKDIANANAMENNPDLRIKFSTKTTYVYLN